MNAPGGAPAARRALGWLRAHRRRLGRLLLGMVLPLVIFAELAEDVWQREGFHWDLRVMRFLHAHASQPLYGVMRASSIVGGSVGLTAIVGVLAVVLVHRHRRWDAGFLIAAVGGALLIELGAKLIFARTRPDLWPAVDASGYSFPSGHATESMAFAVAVVWLAAARRRRLAIVLGALFTLLVGVSRVYLGVHYPSDVVAGWCAGLAWGCGLTLLWRARLRPGHA